MSEVRLETGDFLEEGGKRETSSSWLHLHTNPANEALNITEINLNLSVSPASSAGQVFSPCVF
jgi:hypothetical protein